MPTPLPAAMQHLGIIQPAKIMQHFGIMQRLRIINAHLRVRIMRHLRLKLGQSTRFWSQVINPSEAPVATDETEFHTVKTTPEQGHLTVTMET